MFYPQTKEVWPKLVFEAVRHLREEGKEVSYMSHILPLQWRFECNNHPKKNFGFYIVAVWVYDVDIFEVLKNGKRKLIATIGKVPKEVLEKRKEYDKRREEEQVVVVRKPKKKKIIDKKSKKIERLEKDLVKALNKFKIPPGPGIDYKEFLQLSRSILYYLRTKYKKTFKEQCYVSPCHIKIKKDREETYSYCYPEDGEIYLSEKDHLEYTMKDTSVYKKEEKYVEKYCKNKLDLAVWFLLHEITHLFREFENDKRDHTKKFFEKVADLVEDNKFLFSRWRKK